MGVYIMGMEMPKEQITAVINPDGLVEILSLDNVLLDEFYAVEVKPHGRLIDADALEEYFVNDPSCLTIFEAIKKLQGMPTIIPEEGE